MKVKNLHMRDDIVFLRAISTIAVILYHSRPSINSGGGYVYRLIELCFNWCVPLFFMISGSLFFEGNKNTNFNYMLKKSFHIIKILFIWGFIYNVISTIIIEHSFNKKIFINSILMIFKADTTYCYQFWYLYVLVGIYLMIPIFKMWTDKYFVENNKLSTECILMFVCWLLLSVVLPTFCKGFGADVLVWKGAFEIFSAYMFYVVCGKLYDCIFNTKYYNKIYYSLLIIFSIQLLFFLSLLIFNKKFENWYGYESFFTWNMSSVLYLSAKKINYTKMNFFVKKVYTVVANYSLQIYILHVIVLQIIRKIGFTDNLINPIIYPIINVTITILICIFVAFICKKLKINKLLF